MPLIQTKICIVDDEADSRLADLCMLERKLEEAVSKGLLRAISASSRNRAVLADIANVAAALSVIALPESINMKDAETLMDKQILDTSTVLTMQVACSASKGAASEGERTTRIGIQSEGEQRTPVRGITLLLQESTTNLFFGHDTMRHAGAAAHDPRWLGVTPLNMSPLFASGALLAMTCTDRFTVEAFFTPQVVHLVRLCIIGDQSENRLYQMNCPSEYIGYSYGDLVQNLIKEGQIPLGIFRTPDANGSTHEPGEVLDTDISFTTNMPDSGLSYVITNPSPDSVIMRQSDLIYAIGNRSSSSIVRKIDMESSFYMQEVGDTIDEARKNVAKETIDLSASVSL
jgi:hypothetical protein